MLTEASGLTRGAHRRTAGFGCEELFSTGFADGEDSCLCIAAIIEQGFDFLLCVARQQLVLDHLLDECFDLVVARVSFNCWHLNTRYRSLTEGLTLGWFQRSSESWYCITQCDCSIRTETNQKMAAGGDGLGETDFGRSRDKCTRGFNSWDTASSNASSNSTKTDIDQEAEPDD